MTVNEVYAVVMALDTKINALQEENERLYKKVHTLEAVVESRLLKDVPDAGTVHLNWEQGYGND